MKKIILFIGLITLTACAGNNDRSAAQICNGSSDSRCVGEHVGSECTSNRSHTCIKTGGSALRPLCDCLDSQGGPVPDDYDERLIETMKKEKEMESASN